ncbi:hypothetical protein CDAR_554291 [Caerostris darwini]|uniref:Uncharacterized protein n=1 Tax=Caerostris darwini TaxID=1538125 RepID=A0AAV4SKI7_9ARAC|nr:hypothetical protein CDAR_554291 [Caerostris darwini]
MRYCDPDTMAPDIGEYKQLSRPPTRDAASNARLLPTIDLYICQIQDTSKILLGARVFIYARAEKTSVQIRNHSSICGADLLSARVMNEDPPGV